MGELAKSGLAKSTQKALSTDFLWFLTLEVKYGCKEECVNRRGDQTFLSFIQENPFFKSAC